MTDTDVQTLKLLSKVCIDGEKGFEEAAGLVQAETTRALLQEGARRCREAGDELGALLRQAGHSPETSGSVLGAAHRGWLEIKAGLTAHSDEAILAACHRGEEAACLRYCEALEQIGISPDVRSVIERQYRGAVSNLDKVRSLWSSYAKVPP